MTQEIKDKLKRTAEQDGSVTEYSFIKGAQTILDNPEEWGLQYIEDSDERWCEVVDHFKQEADLYRRALERIASEVNPYIKSHGNVWRIVFEALKQ